MGTKKGMSEEGLKPRAEPSETGKSFAMPALPRYDRYQLSAQEFLRYALTGIGCAAVFTSLFFQNALVFFVLSPIGAFYPFLIRKKLAKKQLEKLLLQWKEAIISISVSLSAGYSVENAFAQTWKDLRQRFGEDQAISREFGYMVHQIGMNVPIERALQDFADRSGLDEVRSFSDIFGISKRSGADLVRIISETGEVIASRVEVKEEIITMMTAVRLEGKIMNVVPLGILAYINLSSPHFFYPMYHTVAGRIVMAVSLIAYLGICWYSGKLMDIEL